jgi:exonuclease III
MEQPPALPQAPDVEAKSTVKTELPASRPAIKVVTYNCKNIQTSEIAFNELVVETGADIILVQEHWLFDNHLQLLSEVHDSLFGTGKAVDSENPIIPSHMPRGYGGVAVLWKKDIDQNVRPLPDGGNRLQVIEVATDPLKTVIVSVYMPTKGTGDNFDDFVDMLEQLHEIIEKYQDTHKVILGGGLQ